MQYEHIVVPLHGRKIVVNTDLSLNVPDKPIIPYIEGDGIGIDRIWGAVKPWQGRTSLGTALQPGIP